MPSKIVIAALLIATFLPQAFSLSSEAQSTRDLPFLKSCFVLCTTLQDSTTEQIEGMIRDQGTSPDQKLLRDALKSLLILKRFGQFNPAMVEQVLISSTRYILESRGQTFPISQLTALETAALTQYSGSDYKRLNQELRTPIPSPDALVYAAYLNSALDKLPIFNGIVKRGVKPFVGWEQLYIEGRTITERAFMSTSSNLGPGPYGEAIEIRFESRTGHDISMLSSTPLEHEVLFKAGTRFKVVKVERPDRQTALTGKIKILLEEVSNR